MPHRTHHRRAGKLGGEMTKARHGDDGYYQRIGALGGKRTMELHGERYDQQNELRDHAIQHMLDDGWKIPTIISLTWEDLPKLDRYLTNGLAEYLERERPDTHCDHLFVSRSGKPLGLANTYAVMKRYRERQRK